MKLISHNGKLWAMIVALLWLCACGPPTGTLKWPGHPGGRCLASSPYELKDIEANRRATFRIDIQPGGHGSGVVISRQGHLATAYHVVDDAKGLSITMVEPGGRLKTYPAQVVAVDKRHDLAIIKIERLFPRAPRLASMDRVRPGDAVYNIGYPHDFGELISRGYVMRLRWSHNFESGSRVDRCLLVDIKNGPGTSGSGVFSSNSGEIVGLLVMKVWVKSTRAPATVVHVVVPANYLRDLMKQVSPVRPSLPSRPPLLKSPPPPR